MSELLRSGFDRLDVARSELVRLVFVRSDFDMSTSFRSLLIVRILFGRN